MEHMEQSGLISRTYRKTIIKLSIVKNSFLHSHIFFQSNVSLERMQEKYFLGTGSPFYICSAVFLKM